MNFKEQFKEGLITQNPVTVQLLGMCSVLAVTTTLFNGIGMGLSVLVVLTCANVVISLLRKIIPNKIRIACYIVVIMSMFRELLGAGTFGGGILNGGLGIRVIPEEYAIAAMTRPVGGFLTLAFVIAAMQYFLNKPKKVTEKKEVASA